MHIVETSKPHQVNKLWGGRFAEGPATIMQEINASIRFDKRLARQDIAGSLAHCQMLMAVGIISREDAEAIMTGFDRIEQEVKADAFPYHEDLEDIHMNLESRLAKLIGDPAGRLHTARSRNDQVATSFRLWIRDALSQLDRNLEELQRALIEVADKHTGTVMPGLTHTQAAQPVTFGHHLLAYVEMLGRDRMRARDARVRVNESPLGSAALAGTPFPIDRDMTAKILGFTAGPMANSMDAVSARDFVLEYLSTCAICAVHLSRLAEDLILWCSDHWRFITMSDSFSSGSSIMPQKRNPDAAELVRAKTGRVNGALIGLLTVVKGLPLTYHKDFQEDKECAFNVFDTMNLSLAALTGMFEDLTVHPDTMRAATEKGFLTATDLADWLVIHLNIPFRQAHHITGRIVKIAEEKNLMLWNVPLADMQTIEPGITQEIFKVLTVDASVASRKSFGGTAPDNVRTALQIAKDKYLHAQS